jgi:hypothetical protein
LIIKDVQSLPAYVTGSHLIAFENQQLILQVRIGGGDAAKSLKNSEERDVCPERHAEGTRRMDDTITGSWGKSNLRLSDGQYFS